MFKKSIFFVSALFFVSLLHGMHVRDYQQGDLRNVPSEMSVQVQYAMDGTRAIVAIDGDTLLGLTIYRYDFAEGRFQDYSIENMFIFAGAKETVASAMADYILSKLRAQQIPGQCIASVDADVVGSGFGCSFSIRGKCSFERQEADVFDKETNKKRHVITFKMQYMPAQQAVSGFTFTKKLCAPAPVVSTSVFARAFAIDKQPVAWWKKPLKVVTVLGATVGAAYVAQRAGILPQGFLGSVARSVSSWVPRCVRRWMPW